MKALNFDKRMKISNLVSISVGVVGIDELKGRETSNESKVVERIEEGKGVEIEELKDLEMSGFLEVEIASDEKEKVRNFKRKKLPEVDPDWSPGMKRMGSKRRGFDERRSGRSDLEGLDYSKPIIQAMPAPHSVKDLLSAFGWKVRKSEGGSKPIYVSPSGCVYESLLKALEAFSCQVSKLKEKERELKEKERVLREKDRGLREEDRGLKEKEVVLAQPEDSFSKCVDYAHGKKRMLQIIIALPAKGELGEAFGEAASCKEGDKKASAEGGIPKGESRKMGCGSLAEREKCYTELNQPDILLGVKSSDCIKNKDGPRDTRLGKQVVDGDEDANKDVVRLSEDIPSQQLKTDKGKVNEGLLMPEEMGHGQANKVAAAKEKEIGPREVKEVAANDERLELCTKVKCLNREKNSSGNSSVLGAKNDQNTISEMPNDGELHGVRRSSRIKGRHVAVDSEFDFELFDGDCSFYPLLSSVDTLKPKVSSTKMKSSNKKNKETSRRLEKTKFREVNELLKSCMPKQKTKSVNSAEKSMLDTQPPKREHDAENCEVSSLVPPEEVIDKEVLQVATSSMPIKQAESGTSSIPIKWRESGIEDEYLTEAPPEEVKDKEVLQVVASSMPIKQGESGTSSMPVKQGESGIEDSYLIEAAPEEVMDKEVLQVATSSMPIMQGESGIEDNYLIEVKNDQNRDNDIHSADMLLDVRRSTRINGRHVPVDDIETDHIGIWAVDDYIYSSDCVCNEVAENDKQPTSSMNDNIERESPTTGNVSLKETSAQKSDFQMPENQKQIESNSSPSKYDDTENINNGVNMPDCKECSPSGNNGVNMPDPKECSPSGNNGVNMPDCKECSPSGNNGVNMPDCKECSPSGNKNEEQSLLTEKRYPSSASKRKSVGGGRSSNVKRKKKKRGGSGLVVRRTGKANHKEKFSSETKVNILSWLIDTGTLVENEKIVYKIENGKGNILKGSVTRRGIRCNCCKKVLSLLEFEAHAGADLHQPWNNICAISGMSLMQCQSVAWAKEKKQRKIGFQAVGVDEADPSDDTCGICADGGQLICCDGCPSTFHQDCVMLKSLPEGDWYCPFCVCAFCMLVDGGQDKCTRNMNLFCCNQCGCKYHIDCAGKEDMNNMGLKSSAYCGRSCEKVASGLSEMIGLNNSIGGSFSWTLLRRMDEGEGICSDQMNPLIIECNVKLSLAFLVLHECFVPLVDHRTGIDMIAQAVYSCGSNFNRLNYEGFYTAILEKDEEIISVATLRFHGTRVAEMPFIGTRPRYRRKGMCRRLLSAIEEMLSSLHVEKLIIPAIPDMLETWTKSFSFKHLEPSHKDEMRNLNMVIFAETTLLQKSTYNTETINARDEELVCTDLDIPNCCSPEVWLSPGGRPGGPGQLTFKDASIRLHKEIRIPDDAEASPHSEVSNGNAFEVLPIPSQLLSDNRLMRLCNLR